MSAFHLKLLAIFSMLVAHIDLLFQLQSIPMFVFGRLAFPIFAFLIANGAQHTKNIKGYGARLFIFACISQLPYVLVQMTLDPQFRELNILFTLFFGLLTIFVYRKTANIFLKWGLIIGILLFADFTLVDYGLPGVLSVLLFYIFFNNRAKLITSQIIVFILLHAVNFPSEEVFKSLNLYYILHTLPLALLALFPILLYNGREGRKLQYLFYLFYPLHFVVIYLILLNF